MKTKDFFFNLPSELIAQEPPRERGTSRLMVLHREQGNWQHLTVKDLTAVIPPDSIIVFNDTRVRKARIFAKSKETGASVEFLFLERAAACAWRVKTNKLKKLKPGKVFLFPGNIEGVIAGCEEELRIVEFSAAPEEGYFEQYGHVPLPPYIKRPDKAADAERYQTIYARMPGSAAAPTAGLHFTDEIMTALADRGCRVVYVTLHVGLGTFLPIRTDTIEEHKMHEESYTISPEAATVLNTGLSQHKRIFAVGTTVVRTLESAFKQDLVQPGSGRTSIYIYPGFRFRVVSGLFTNFHTPGSTLLLLVSAFAGKELIDRAYQEAIMRKYHFFSYGDAMLIL